MVEQIRLFVGNLPANTAADEIKDLFSYYGKVIATDFKVKTDTTQQVTGKGFAFVTLETDADNIDMCIQEFSHEEWKGTKLYVTRARENFMDRLKKERAETEGKKGSSNVMPVVTSTNVNPLKMKIKLERTSEESFDFVKKKTKFDDNKNNMMEKQTDFVSTLRDKNKLKIPHINANSNGAFGKPVEIRQLNGKQADADSKRVESMRNMRKAFNEKKSLINQGLASVDKRMNKKIVFSDDEISGTIKSTTSEYQQHNPATNAESKGYKKTLFDGEESDNEDDVSFRVKEQFEGKRGQKLLELQTRYKADKRFTLDERFVDTEDGDENNDKAFNSVAEEEGSKEDRVELADDKEKIKQMNILQDVLGISVKSSTLNAVNDSSNKKKASTTRLGMLRYDPSRPEHEKFIAPTDSSKSKLEKKSKKERKREREDQKLEEIKSIEHTERTHPAIEVSKETFYKVSDSLKDAIGQPKEFSLRSLFSKELQDDTYEKDASANEEIVNIATNSKRKDKVKNPFDTTDKNPFKYDSSDSEPEEDDVGQGGIQEISEDIEKLDDAVPKAVWSENFFFTLDDVRLTEGLSFFMAAEMNPDTKDRRQLKFVMKKRLQNSARNDRMFKKKIGGKRRQNFSSKKNFKYTNRKRN